MKEYKIIYDHRDLNTEEYINQLASDGWILRFAIAGNMSADGDRAPQFIMERDRPEAEKVPS